MAHPVEFISTHPLLAFVVMATTSGATFIIPEMQIPLIFMQLLQAAAWIITISVGLITIYKFFKVKE